MCSAVTATRLRLLLAAGALMAVGAVGVTADTAAASAPSVTLAGSALVGITPDSFGDSTIAVDATVVKGKASGTLETGGRSGGVGDTSHYEFSGKVTCMLQRNNITVIGAFGTVVYHHEVGPINTETLLPGTYQQIAVVEAIEPHEEGGPGGNFAVRHTFGSLGEHHEGLPSAHGPKCPAFGGIELLLPGPGDSMYQSPSITSPKDGYKSPSATVKLNGTGEAFTSIKVYEVGHKSKATTVPVGSSGKWSLTLAGLAAGSHEYVAVAVAGSAVQSNTVMFTVP